MSGPFNAYFGNQRTIVIPVGQQDYDRVTVTAVAAVNFSDLLAIGANSQALLRVQYYLHWLTVTTTTFPAAVAAVAGFLQIEAIDAGAAVVAGPINVKAFMAEASNLGPDTPYVFTPAAAHRLPLTGAGLATAVNIRVKANVTVIAGAPSFIIEIGDSVDNLNVGPPGAIGGPGIIAQGANNPNAF